MPDLSNELSIRAQIALVALPATIRIYGSVKPMAVKSAFEYADEFLRQEEEYLKAQPAPPAEIPRPNFYEDK